MRQSQYYFGGQEVNCPASGRTLLRLQLMNATEIELIFEEMHSHEQMIKIADGKVDIGIFRLPVQNPLPQLQTEVLIKEKMVIAVREDHPVARLKKISAADLRGEGFVIWRSEERKVMHDHLLALAQAGGFPLCVAQSA
jgi:DNA-binding transcriptional LysR family regulator